WKVMDLLEIGNLKTGGKDSQETTVVCPRNYEPVCGTNGVTYPNECSLCRELFRNQALDKKHDGRCVKVRTINGANIPCSLEYTPICGTNGVTYRNKCHFCNAVATSRGSLFLRHRGAC
uniref:Ovomucoid n=1 Tax=Calidris pygmaea TaxID=425635 RepID=A0A8C3KEM7_9CHAR